MAETISELLKEADEVTGPLNREPTRRLIALLAAKVRSLDLYGDRMRQTCKHLSDRIHELDPSAPVPE